MVMLFIILGFIFPATDATQCACATGNVHVRSGAGTSHPVLGTLTSGHCVPYKLNQVHVGSLEWAHVEYIGRDGYIATNWLNIQDMTTCSKTVISHGTSSLQLPGCPRMISRSEWGARSPKHHISFLSSTPQNVYIHHGASAPCFDEAHCKKMVKFYQHEHMDGRGWADIGYTFVIGEDGNVYEGRGWGKLGSHTYHHNHDGLGFCVIGNFMTHVPNNAALNAVKQLIACAASNGKIRSNYVIKGHRDVRATACPGDKFYALIRAWPHYHST